MKKIVSIITVLLAVLFVQAQTITQNGVSYRYNGKNPRTPIGGVYIKPVTADNGVVSNASNGSFSVVLKNLKMGSRIGNVKVTKQGMMVFNQQAVDEWNVRKDPLCLILCDANEFQKQKKNLIAIGERQAKKKYDKKLAELKKRNEAQQLQIDDYYNKLDSLEKEYQNALKHMDEYADVFARIDESEVDTLAQRAIELFNKGEIDESIRLFEQGNYMKKLDDALHTKAQAQNLRNVADSAEALADKDIEEYVKSIKAQVSAYQVKNDYEKVGELLKGMADKLQTLEAIWNYIDFCSMQNEFKEEELYLQKYNTILEKSQRIDKPELLAKHYCNLAIFYQKVKSFNESEKMFNISLTMYKQLNSENTIIYGLDMAWLYNNFANLYREKRRFVESEKMFNSALNIYESLNKESITPLAFNKAALYNNLANLYSDIKEYDKSESMFSHATEAFESLANENPKKYEPNLAILYNNFALFYSENLRFNESESMYKKALLICSHLTKENPEAYEPLLACLYQNLGIHYDQMGYYHKSEAMYRAALTIRERIVINNPKVYEPALANSYYNLANLYCHMQRFSESETMHKAALTIREHLAKVNYETYAPFLADSYNALGVLYKQMKRFEESDTLLNSALSIYKTLVNNNPKAYETVLAGIYNNLANLSFDMHRYIESEKMYKSALTIYEQSPKDNPDKYYPYLANVYKKMAILYSKKQCFDKSESMYRLCSMTYLKLYEKSPDLYQQDLAESYYWLGRTMVVNKKNHEAIDSFEKSLRLTKDDFNEKKNTMSYASNLVQLVDLNGIEKSYFVAYNYNSELLHILKNIFLSDTIKYKNDYLSKLVSQSFYANLLGKFKEGEECSLEALQVDSTKYIAYTNLAAALLFQGKIEEAEKIYRQYKSEFKDGFLDDFAEYERLQIIPKEYMADVERIKAMLQE